MSAKKKTPAKKAPKTTAFDAALEPPAAKAVVAVEPMEVTTEDALDETAGEAWPNYSPFPEEETEGPGFSPAKEQPAWMPTADELDAEWKNVESDAQAEALGIKAPADESVLGAGEPVSASGPLSGTECHNIPCDAAKTVRDIIEGLNYLWKMAQTIRGPRGPKMHDESILKKRVAKARELEKLLAGLK